MKGLLKIGAFWKKADRNGNTYYSGTFDAAKVTSAIGRGEKRLLLFPADKRVEKGPDVEMFSVPETHELA